MSLLTLFQNVKKVNNFKFVRRNFFSSVKTPIICTKIMFSSDYLLLRSYVCEYVHIYCKNIFTCVHIHDMNVYGYMLVGICGKSLYIFTPIYE